MKKNRITSISLKSSARIVLILFILVVTYCCEGFVEIDEPPTETTRENVFNTDEETATSAINGIYASMISIGTSMFTGRLEQSVGLTSDEMANFSALNSFIEYESNSILPTNTEVSNIFWSQPYQLINNCNGVIEGLTQNSTLSPDVADSLLGEAFFLRAFVHFYLTNIFGPIPYSKTTDVETNNNAKRLPVNEVYDNIIADLIEAESL